MHTMAKKMDRPEGGLASSAGVRPKAEGSDEHLVSAWLEGSAFAQPHSQVARIRGSERIGELFGFDIDIAAVDASGFDPEALTGAPAELVFQQGKQAVRRIAGVVCRTSEWLDNESAVPLYRLRFVPRAHLLTLVRTQQVYLDLTVPKLIEQKLRLVDLAHRFDLHQSYDDREIVVQYGETDIAFISRLCEHLGISFYFVHDATDGEVMVFTDAQRFFALPKPRQIVPFRSRGETIDVYRLERTTQLIPRVYMVSDYNYRTPLVDLTAVSESQNGAGGGIIEYGGHFKTPTDGAALAAIRREEQECRRVVYHGACDRPDIAAGSIFSLNDHPRYGDKRLLVISAEHELEQTTQSHSRSGGYVNRFVAIDADTPYRPDRRTPRPHMHGIVNALVLPRPGSDGTQPWLDDSGRYVVRLLFDTADAEGKASHTIRMAQAHAGPDFGIHFPLRPGVEVLLAFINGDPDRPIIVGAIPNAVTPTPVVDKDALFHRIKTATGVKIEIEDGF